MKKIFFLILTMTLCFPLFSYLFDVGETKKTVDDEKVSGIDKINSTKILNAQKLENLKKQSSEIISIGLMPFKDVTTKIRGDKIIFQKIKTELEASGLKVSKYRLGKKIRWKNNIVNFETLSSAEIASIGKEYGFDYMIVGKLKKLKAEKKFKFGNFLSFPLGLGGVLYGEVDFTIRVIKVSNKSEIYKNEFFNKRKNQVGGIFQGDGAVLNRNLKDIMDEMIEDIKPLFK